MGKIYTFAFVGVFVWASFAQAQMSSTNYEIRWDTISTGGSDSATSTSYDLRDTMEIGVSGTGTSTSYQLDQGYRTGVFDQVITFSVFAQDVSSVLAATALSGTTVTSDTTGISVNDYIVVIQDLGTSNIAAIGKVSSIGAGTITVDEFKNGGTTPTVDGTNDYVYLLSGAAIAFGDFSSSSIASAVIGWEVTVDNENGYVVQVVEDGDLRSGSDDINDVTDGTVTNGSEEYGARSSDTTIAGSTFDTADTGITTSFQNIATESTFAFESRNFLTLKTSISSSSNAGSYAHSVSVIASGNF